RASLPRLDGEVAAAGLAGPVTVERDAAGIPTVRGASRADVAFGTGFVHAQDRFFQMDLLRRRSAGELAELLGQRALEQDRENRRHRFRARAEEVLSGLPPEHQAVLAAYAAGVNAALSGAGAPPFEHVLLRSDAEPWAPEDSLLVLFSMFFQMGDADGSGDSELGMMQELLPRPLFEFLTPAGTEWDAPMVGEAFTAPPVPAPGQVDLRSLPKALPKAARWLPSPEAAAAGAGASGAAASNGWAVSGRRTANGAALLAADLHFDLTVPNIWYRASFVWPAGNPAEGAAGEWRVTGATLPGAPAMVLGSNGHVSWGVTNGMFDTSDIVLLDVDPRDPGRYRTSAGTRPFERFEEVLRIQGGGEERMMVDWTVWGPVVDDDYRGRRRALRWTAHEAGAVDFEILRLETARTLEESLDAAHHSGVPALSFLAADRSGRVAWTVLGRLPRRVGFAGRLPGSWADGSRRWEGLLPPEQVPQLVEPESGRVWSANNRPVGGEMLARVPDGGYTLGARAMQIRDRLFAVEKATVEDMRRIQLDDEALFLRRWRGLLLEILTPQAIAARPQRGELRELVENWGGRASVDSAGYRMVRSYRVLLARDLFGWLTAPCVKAAPGFDVLDSFDQAEGPLWHLVTERPAHLLNPKYASWEEQLLASVDEVLSLYGQDGPLKDRTWGERNMADIRHLLSPALPGAGRWLDMPAEPLPGSDYMPRVQEPSYGSSLRMVVSPGREAEGFFHMPGGQSGHPLSPHYRDAHAAWVEGARTPFLPGPPAHTLRLTPREKK
ncbi:MAG TPA: penicillin acylase family protein, partial [Thermoanaerobaculia bacterium]|nr:penicillin acylase family protein [Thermoanaerobaculia bacterium]